jgi:hypothetical protein
MTDARTLKEMIEHHADLIAPSYDGPRKDVVDALTAIAREAATRTVFELRPGMSVNENYVNRIVGYVLGEEVKP